MAVQQSKSETQPSLCIRIVIDREPGAQQQDLWVPGHPTKIVKIGDDPEDDLKNDQEDDPEQEDEPVHECRKVWAHDSRSQKLLGGISVIRQGGGQKGTLGIVVYLPDKSAPNGRDAHLLGAASVLSGEEDMPVEKPFVCQGGGEAEFRIGKVVH